MFLSSIVSAVSASVSGSKLLFFLEFPKLFISVLYDQCKVQAIYIDIYLHLALNPFIETFNGSFRNECLNTNWFLSLSDARTKIEFYRLSDAYQAGVFGKY